ncbi:AAA family ATPase [Pseudooceanicola onchidii]|uniref:AAA family ATPase n=1 Tax=Pseudooceanicola onchidii TaxID=2562279 RepID=UPI0010AADF0D|nr:AAA family ATPase [Pseudooceanicola onchidii]
MDLDALAALAGTLGPESTGSAARRPGSAGPAPARLFSTWEITDRILPMAPNHLRRSLRANPDWPQGRSQEDGRLRWFTLDEVHALRRAFAASGGARHLPDRPPGAPLILTLVHPRPGTGKTTTAAHLAQGAAMAGYRVLVLDLAPSGRLSQLLGAPDPAPALPLLAAQAARHLRDENRLRLSRGEPVLTPDADLDGAEVRAPSPTAWAGVDLLGGGLTLAPADQKIAGWQHLIRSWRPWEALRAGLDAAGHLAPSDGPALLSPDAGYDLILIDTPPALGPLTLSAVIAADILLMPFAATSAEIAATSRGLTLLRSEIAAIETREGLAARALGETPRRFTWSALRTLLTRFDPATQTRAATGIQTQMGETLLMPRQEAVPLLADPDGPGTIYGLDYRTVGRDRHAALRRDPDAIQAAVHALMAEVWREKLAEAALDGPAG